MRRPGDELAHRVRRAGAVLDDHGVDLDADERPVERDHDQPVIDVVAQVGRIAGRGRDEQRVHATLDERAHELQLAVGVVMVARDHELEVARAERALDASDQLCEERVRDVRDDQADRGARPTRGQRAREQVGPEAERTGGREYARALRARRRTRR